MTRRDPIHPDPARLERSSLVILAVALAGIIAIYGHVIFYPYTNWDDPGYVTENSALAGLSWDQVRTQLSTYVMGNYHPVTMLSYSLEITLAGRSAMLMHATNITLHAFNCLLVFFALRRLFSSGPMAAWAALLFALHPMRVETVAWIADRKDLLATCFGLLMILAHLRSTRTGGGRVLSSLFFLLACLSKATAVALLPILPVIDHLQGRDMRQARPWLNLMPHLIIALATGLIAVNAQATTDALTVVKLPLGERMIAAAASALYYTVHQLVPVDLHALYPYRDDGQGLPEAYPLLAAVLVLIICASMILRPKLPRPALFGLLFMAITLAPVLQLVSVGMAVRADRYTYMPAIGWSLLAVAVLRGPAFQQRPLRRWILFGVASCYLIWLGWSARLRTAVWQDGISVWNDILAAVIRSSTRTLMNRGVLLASMGRGQQALADMDQAIAGSPVPNVSFHHNRGLLLYDMENYQKALDDLMIEVRSGAMDQELFEKLTYCQMKVGMCDDVVTNCDAFLARDPRSTFFLDLRSLCSTQLGRLQEAIDHADRSLALDPMNARAHYAKAIAYLAAGDTLSACPEIRASADGTNLDPVMRANRDELRRTACLLP